MLSYDDASYVYGKRGDLQQKIVGTDTTTYNYDNLGNLHSVTLPDGTLIEYLIDGDGRRVAKKVDGQLTKRWLYAGGLLPVAELDSTGAVEKRYGPGYVVKNDSTYRVIRDHLGSVRMVVNSQTGDVVQRIDYDVWGNITYLQNQDEFTDIGFAGGLYDKDTGLIRFGARDYDPEVGRWTAKDPIMFDGGTSNLYEYVYNDPINSIDINGLQRVIISQPHNIMVNGTIAILNIVGATSDFIGNYRDMREANTIGADKYFHCMANCEATSRGLGAYKTAETISEGRELYDQYIKGDSAEACDADRAANKKGRDPKGDSDCKIRCQEFRPEALDEKY